MNVYYDPEKSGLETIGEVQWGEPCYSFDLTVVWRRIADGVFLYAEDSGCSCPSPFDNIGVDDLKPATPLETFKAHLAARAADIAGYGSAYDPSPSAVAELLERMHAAGAR